MAGQSVRPSHETTHFPYGTPDGFWVESGERPRGSDSCPTWRSTEQSAPPKPRLMRAFTPLLRYRMLCSPLGFHTAIAHEMERPVLGWWQGVEGFLHPPLQQQMDIPIGRLEHTAKTPSRDRARSPTGQLFQCFPPWKEGLHDDEPTEHETVTVFPDTGHTAKKDRDEQRQIGDRNHSRPYPAKGESDHA